MKRWLVLSSMLAAAAFTFSSVASAQDVVKQRLDAMKTISNNLKVLQKSAKDGKVSAQDKARAAEAAAKVKGLTKLFPAGTDSDKVKTRAKPALWKDWAKFEAQAEKLSSALDGVQKAAASGDAKALAGAVKEARATCGGCHKPFRGPKPK